MADNLKKQPKKGILKNSSSFESTEHQRELAKGTKWDEMNIIATLHPQDKDYGHMKIEEPKTPFSYGADDSGDEIDGIDPELLAKKIELGGSELPKAIDDGEDEISSSDDSESPEEKAKRKMFEMKRKHHYNEFAAVKLARKLMEHDSEEELEKDNEGVDSIAEEDEYDKDNNETDLCEKKDIQNPD